MSALLPRAKILIFILFSCNSSNFHPSEEFASSEIATLEFRINNEIHLFDENYNVSYQYDRGEPCLRDAYFYGATSYDTTMNIHLGTAIPHNSNNLLTDSQEDINPINQNETDVCSLPITEDGFFITKNNIKYNYQHGIFQKEMGTRNKRLETSRDFIIFKDAVFENEFHETLVLNANYDLNTSFILVP